MLNFLFHSSMAFNLKTGRQSSLLNSSKSGMVQVVSIIVRNTLCLMDIWLARDSRCLKVKGNFQFQRCFVEQMEKHTKYTERYYEVIT